jgi:hypothetical protein
MANIEKRRRSGRMRWWRARYRVGAGHEHSKHFERKVDGQHWLDQVTAAVVTGRYAESRAGRVTLRDCATAWASRRVGATTRRGSPTTPCVCTSSLVPRPPDPLRPTQRQVASASLT